MVKSKIVRAAAVAATSFGLIAGVSGIAGASSGMGSIHNTGPDSYNKVVSVNKAHTHVSNSNDLGLVSTNDQYSHSGSAIVAHNTTGGGAMSGAASNDNHVGATVNITNTTPVVMDGAGMGTNDGSIDTTGPNSYNKVVGINKTSVQVDNTNNISLTTTNSQSAVSGKAVVAGNTTGGNASSGDATNTSTSTFNVTVHN